MIALLNSKWTVLIFALCFSAVSLVAGFSAKFAVPEFAQGYHAAEKLRQSSAIYDITPSESHKFELSPTVLPIYSLFTSFDINTASKLFFMISLLASILSIYRLLNIINAHFPNHSSIQFNHTEIVPLLAISPLILDQLVRGSNSLIILFCFTVVIDSLLIRRKVFSGIILGILFLIAPETILLLIPLLIFHRWRTLIPFLVVVVAGWTLIIPFVGGNIAAGTLVLDWYAMQSENGLFSRSELSIASILYSNNLFSLRALGVSLLLILASTLNPLWFRFRRKSEYSKVLLSMMIVVFAVGPLVISDGISSYIVAIPLLILGLPSVQPRIIWRLTLLLSAALFAVSGLIGSSGGAFVAVIVIMACSVTLLTSDNNDEISGS